MRSTLDRPVMGAPLPTAHETEPCFIVRDQTARRSLAFTAMMKPAGRHGAMVALPQQRGCPMASAALETRWAACLLLIVGFCTKLRLRPFGATLTPI